MWHSLGPCTHSQHTHRPILVQELEDARAGKSNFRANSLTYALRQNIFKFIQGRDPADPGLQGLILHELPKAEPDWDLTMSGFLPFLLRPPQPNTAQAAAAAAPQQAQAAGPDAASRQRVGSRVDASTGQQARDFNSYSANKPLPISDADNEPGHIHFVTAPCKNSEGRPIGTYRGFVCVMKQVGLVATGCTRTETTRRATDMGLGSRFPNRRSQQQNTGPSKRRRLEPTTAPAVTRILQGERPAGGRDWCRLEKLQLRGDGGGLTEGWVDVSVALGVVEPLTETQQPRRKRAR